MQMEEKNTLSIKRKIGLALAAIGVLVFIFGIILSVKIKVVGGIIISICAASIFIEMLKPPAMLGRIE